MTITAEKKQILQGRQLRLSAIKTHSAWEELKEEFERKKKMQETMLLVKWKQGKPVDQRELDFYRGFWAGCEWLLKNPDMAEGSLKHALQGAQLLEQE